jgi:hypothetical protein
LVDNPPRQSVRYLPPIPAQAFRHPPATRGSRCLPTSRLQPHASRWVHGPGSMRAPSVAVPFFLSQQLVDPVQQLCIVPVEHPSRFEHGQALPGEGHPSSLADRYG